MRKNTENFDVKEKSKEEKKECLSNHKQLDIENRSIPLSLDLIHFLLENRTPGITFATGLIRIIWGAAGTSQWDRFIREMEELINQRLEQTERNRAIANLQGISNVYKAYVEALGDWDRNKESIQAQERVRARFVAIDSTLRRDIPTFSIHGFELTTLSVYAQAANLHLSVLRDAVTFGKGWNLSENNINDYNRTLVENISRYTDHCVHWANEGKRQMIVRNRINPMVKFKREITLSVLDLVALYSLYDINIYPVEIKTQLSREVYTDLGYESGGSVPLSNPRILFREPHLAEFLEELTIYTGRMRVATIYRGSGWSGHTIRFRRSGQNSTHTHSLQGFASNHIPPVTIFGYMRPLGWGSSPINRFLFDIVQWSGGGPTGAQISDGLFVNTVSFEQRYRNPMRRIDTNHQLPNGTHRLCHAQRVILRDNPGAMPSGPRELEVPLLGWTHRSLTHNNFISSNVITQIPIAKMNQLNSGASMIEDPGFCGGDIVRINRNGSVGSFTINNNSNSAIRYRVRIRYASSSPVRFDINLGGNVNQRNFEATMNRDANLTYSSFKTASYSTPYNMREGEQTLQLFVQDLPSGHSVHIDKVEIVPVFLSIPFSNEVEKD